MLHEVTVSLPPLLEEIDSASLVVHSDEIRQAEQAMTETDARFGKTLTTLSSFLIRTEGVASSKIEQLESSATDYALALAGSRANMSAVSMVAAGAAIENLVSSATPENGITQESILKAHKVLMESDPHDRDFAGRWRTMQNWIGGSDYSPRNALFVPPPPETVEMYMTDLVTFSRRSDISPLVQATLLHAQFESIHPFTDGNGRIGRALINAVLRTRGITAHTVVPLASALVANTTGYFAGLAQYREGDLAMLLNDFANGARIAAEETQQTASLFVELPQMWAERVSGRQDSAARRLLKHLLSVQSVNSHWVESVLNTSPKSALEGIDSLEEVGILEEITGRKRNRVWVVSDVMAELEDLNNRIEQRALLQ
jgi:Fic family protein